MAAYSGMPQRFIAAVLRNEEASNILHFLWPALPQVTTGDERQLKRLLIGKPEVKRPLVRPRRRWELIRTDFKYTGLDCVDWIDLTEHWGKWRNVANTAINLRVQ
jgi:hypothetical protein